jgi:Domain of unknown function (DUF4390)
MDFFTHCWKSGGLNRAMAAAFAACLAFHVALSHAQTPGDAPQLKVEREGDEIWISAQVQFELPSAVEDALQKGVPLFFVAEVDVLRERWYWVDKKVVAAQRHLRLAYQPLTRRWRLTLTSGMEKGAGLGLALNQYYETLPQALAIIKRISRWQIVDITDLDPANKYRVEFRFKLDLAQLPLPFQIGTLGQSDWDVSQVLGAPLRLKDMGK